MFDLQQPWQEIAKQQQAIRNSHIAKEWILKDPPAGSLAYVMDMPYTCGILTTEELGWTEKDATELLGLFTTGQLKSADVTLAFCKRAAIAQQVVQCPNRPVICIVGRLTLFLAQLYDADFL
jgi:amidase